MIRNRADYPGEQPHDQFDCIYLEKKDFCNLRDFVTENRDVTVEIEETFSFTRSGGKEVIRIRNYVGIIETKSKTIVEVLPKIYLGAGTRTEDEEVRQTRLIFLRMLRYLRDAPFKKIDEAHLRITRFPILEVFISSFLSELDLLVKQGINKHYVSQEINHSILKGRLLFHEQIRQNLIHPERFFIHYEEFSENIPQNRIIKSALSKISTKSRSIINQNLIRQFLFILDEIPLSEDIETDLAACRQKNRLFSHYQQVLTWSSVFLKDQSFTNFRGKHINQAILFPMERIFEDYVAAGFKKYLKEYSIVTQEKKHHLVDFHIDAPKFRLKPDIVLRNDNTIFIIDSKWKLIEESSPQKNYGISQQDMYQLFGYGEKYHDKECLMTRLFLLYPKYERFGEKLPIFTYKEGMQLEVLPFDLSTSLDKAITKMNIIGHLNP